MSSPCFSIQFEVDVLFYPFPQHNTRSFSRSSYFDVVVFDYVVAYEEVISQVISSGNGYHNRFHRPRFYFHLNYIYILRFVNIAIVDINQKCATQVIARFPISTNSSIRAIILLHRVTRIFLSFFSIL